MNQSGIDIPEPCTQDARDQGCTCYIPTARALEIDPPEPRGMRDCPLHGRDPDEMRQRKMDERDDR